MRNVAADAARIADLYRSRAGRWMVAVTAGLRRALALVDAQAQALLSGAGAPWSYPVPVRTGNLRRHEGMRLLSPTSGMVFNTADYANAVHTGRVGQWAGRGKSVVVQRAARPFLDDALERVRPEDVVIGELLRAL